jgi:hypothetical protein
MKSRTAEGKHTPRFIVQYTTERGTYRSGNERLSGSFDTRKAAQAAIATYGSQGLDYKVRQK